MRTPTVMLCLVALGALMFSPVASSQYPRKPIRLIVPFPPGGGTDTIGRAVSQKLSDAFKQQVIMVNRPGAGVNTGVELVAKSPPDGYTLLLSTISNSISASLYSKLNYDLLRDLSPVACHAAAPFHRASVATALARPG